MPARQTIAELGRFAGRGPGTDAERRAALWLAGQLRQAGRQVDVETFWCRPNWALAHAWHVALALAGTLLSVPFPRVGLAMILAALVCLLADELLGISPGRRLMPERASQNVIARQRGNPSAHRDAADASEPPQSVRPRLLIVTNYDAGRTGLVDSRIARRIRAVLRTLTRGRGPGWMAWLVVALIWLAVVAAVRSHGHRTTLVGALQLVPAAGLVVALALLLEAGTAALSPAASDNGSGTAVALALARAIDAAPPRHLDVDVVLCGAHEGGGLGLAHHLRAQRRHLPAAPLCLLGLAACGNGRPRWWLSDGPLIPRRASPLLVRLCRQAADQTPDMQAAPHRGRGRSPAWRRPALPFPRSSVVTITLGALDARGQAPHSHQASDRLEAVDAHAPDRVLELALIVIDALDAELAARPATPQPAPIPA